MKNGKEGRSGLVMVYTGDGKGKTTAAVGMGLRAVGHGLKVYLVNFLKGADYGEYLAAARHLPDFTIIKAGRVGFINRGDLDPIDLKMAAEGFQKAKVALLGGEYSMVILDEINVAVDYGLIPLQDLLELINNRPPGVDIVLTGRAADKALIEVADLVSEVKAIKHHYAKGIKARKGIEY